MTINNEFNDLPFAPVLADPGDTDDDGAFSLSWSIPYDDGQVVSYLIQVSNTSGFGVILDSATPTTNSESVAGLPNGTYYFRVRALDDDGEYGYWSNTESILVAIPPGTTTPPPPPPPIPGFPLAAIVVGAGSALALTVVLRRRKK
jgi:hypothetical protein